MALEGQPGKCVASNKVRRVLVVDDNKVAANVLGQLLKILGHDVRTAYNGQQAIEVAAEFLPDVVLMDVAMPGMSGSEVAEHIREQPWGKTMLLVALTGWVQGEGTNMRDEFDCHLLKPAEVDELQKIIQ